MRFEFSVLDDPSRVNLAPEALAFVGQTTGLIFVSPRTFRTDSADALLRGQAVLMRMRAQLTDVRAID